MAIVSAGYDGTVNETQFARMFNRYSVVGADDFDATTGAGDRIVSIANGTALGPGTVDVATDVPALQFDAATGTRYDLVVLRRDWQPPGGSSTVTIVKGGTARALPTRNTNPGVIDDQPLYLQRVDGNLLGERIDLRVWASNGGLVAADPLALSYLSTPGAVVQVGDTEYRYLPGSNGVFGWDGRQTLFREWNAVTTVTVNESAGGSKVVAFPAGMFTVPPIVHATKQSGQMAKYIPYVTDITATSCRVGLYSGDASGNGGLNSIPVAIQCIQTASNRAGGV